MAKVTDVQKRLLMAELEARGMDALWSELLVGVDDHPAALARFVETLPATDRDHLRRMLRSEART